MNKSTFKHAILALSLLGFAQIGQAKVLDSVAAIVNNDIILSSELNNETALIEKNNKKLNHLAARELALDNLVTKSLIMQMAKTQGIDLTDTQVDAALEQEARKYNTSVKDVLKSFGDGISTAKARELFKEKVIANEIMLSRVKARINISNAEVQLVAKNLKEAGSVEPKYHLGQIIIPTNPEPSDAFVNKIKNEMKDDANFANLSSRFATGAGASQVGDLGYIPEMEVPPPFLPALLKAKAGDVIGPFRSAIGLHLIKLFDVSYDAIEPIKLYDASHILLKTSIIFSDDAAKKELENIRSQIVSGKISFENAAKKYSEDIASAVNGGDLGYATPDIYDPAFAQAMVRLQKGQISEPIRSSFGWHLIKLNNTKIDKNSDQAYLTRARNLIFNRSFQQELVSWQKELKENANIQVLDPTLKNNSQS